MKPVRVDEDPGAVSLRVSAADAEEAFTWQGTLNEGERVRVDVVLPGADGESIFESPWFWIVTGAVVAAGAAVGLYFILDGAADLEPNSKNVVNLDL